MTPTQLIDDITRQSEQYRQKSDVEIADMLRDMKESYLFQESAHYIEHGITLNRLAKWAGYMATTVDDNDRCMLLLESMERLMEY